MFTLSARASDFLCCCFEFYFCLRCERSFFLAEGTATDAAFALSPHQGFAATVRRGM